MRFNKIRSLAAKLLAISATAVALVLVVSNTVQINQTREAVVKSPRQEADLQAEAISNKISGQIAELAASARSMMGVIATSRDNDLLDRHGIARILKANLEQNELAYGSWFCEQSGVFDGKVQEVAGRKDIGVNDKGAFTPSWTKNAQGEITFSTFDNDYDAAWYKAARDQHGGSITPPYLANYTDVPTMMTTISYPVVSKGMFVGVGGIDISLKTLTDTLQTIRPFGSGRVYLVGREAQWIVAPSEDLISKPYDQAGKSEIEQAISSGTPVTVRNLVSSDGNAFERIVRPFVLPGLNSMWAIVVDVPDAVIETPQKDQTRRMIILAFFSLFAVLAVLYSAVTFVIRNPLKNLLNEVSALSSGKIDAAVQGQQRKDEIGAVANALEGFRVKLAYTRDLEAEAAEQRAQAERDRASNDRDRQEALLLQQKIVASVGSGLSELSKGRSVSYRGWLRLYCRRVVGFHMALPFWL